MNVARRDHPPGAATLVVGAGGLLGSKLTAALRKRAGGPVITQRISWATTDASADLARALDHLVDAARLSRMPWRIAWCAGAGVTGTSAADLAHEVATLTGFLHDLATRDPGPGTVFLASSAGGLYAGALSGPHRESDSLAPISDYGRAKVAAEVAAVAYAARTGNTLQIGRIANLYGPGQNLAKAQGLITALCRAGITRQPVSIYVSLDTIRDYLFVDDCAEMIADMLHYGRPPGRLDGSPVIKLLASQHGTTIASLIAVCRQVFKRSPLVSLSSSANEKFQVRDLRFCSEVWPQIDARTLTTLPAGIAATAAAILRSTQRADSGS